MKTLPLLTFESLALLLTAVALSMVAAVVASDLRAGRPALVVVCDSGDEYANEARIRDPYYKYSWKCSAGDANGRRVEVVVID